MSPTRYASRLALFLPALPRYSLFTRYTRHGFCPLSFALASRLFYVDDRRNGGSFRLLTFTPAVFVLFCSSLIAQRVPV